MLTLFKCINNDVLFVSNDSSIHEHVDIYTHCGEKKFS